MLKTPAKRVKEITPEILRLLDDMLETMYEARGIGLAAPQVGVGLRIIVVHLWDEAHPPDPTGAIRLINPSLAKVAGEDVDSEACLSLPGIVVSTKRFRQVVVKGLNEKGRRVTIEAEGYFARVFQHEIDHLNGTLIVHRAIPGSIRKVERPKEIPPEEAQPQE
ncbi:MAG: peptide deformylase [bacterium]